MEYKFYKGSFFTHPNNPSHLFVSIRKPNLPYAKPPDTNTDHPVFSVINPRTDGEICADFARSSRNNEHQQSDYTNSRQGRKYDARRETEAECFLVSYAQHVGDVCTSVGQSRGKATAQHLYGASKGICTIHLAR